MADVRGPASGFALVLAVTAVAYGLGRAVPVVGGPVFGLAIGMTIGTAVPLAVQWRPGRAFTSRYVLQAGIVALGATLSLSEVTSVGRTSLPVMVSTLAAAFVAAFFIGRLIGVLPPLRTLIGVGTGVCGASAIAAVSRIVGATEAEVAYALSTIFVFNLVAVVGFPLVGHHLGLSQEAFGIWAGTAINDTSSVVAAAYSYGDAAGAQAVVVKLTRTLMIVPIAAALALANARRAQAIGVRPLKLIPWFLLWF